RLAEGRGDLCPDGDPRGPAGRRDRSDGGRATGRYGCIEDDVHPVVARLVGVGREAAGAVAMEAVGAIESVRERMERRAVEARHDEVRPVHGVPAVRGVIRDDVGRVSGDRYRRGQGGLLPPRGRFACKGDARQESPGVRPEMAGMGPSVGRPLVEAYRGDVATEVGAEPHPQLNRIRVVPRRYGGGRRVTPNATWTRWRGNGDSDTRTRRFDIAT